MKRTNVLFNLWLTLICRPRHQNSVLAFFVSKPPPLGLTSSTTTSQPSTTKAEQVSSPFLPAKNTLATTMTTTEKVAMNVIGVGLTTAVVTSLANSKLNAFLMTPSPSLLNLEEVGSTILKVSVPSSTAEVVSVTLAESAAGVVAAAVSLLVAVGLGAGRRNDGSGTTREVVAVNTIGKAIGNGDFLVAQATAMPILESLGIPPAAATIVAVVFAAVPAELVKITSTKKAVKKLQEERLLQQLLMEESSRNNREQLFPLFDINNNKSNPTRRAPSFSMDPDIDLLSTKNVNDGLVVEIVSDLIKWLGYAVLCSDLGGRIVLDDGRHPFPGLESAAFGAIASLSAQLYSDVLYAYFGFGGVEKQQQVRSRTLQTWLSSYTNEAVGGATLFGVYDIIKIPSIAFISAFLSGGVEGCLGSQDYNVCLQSYMMGNPPGASPEAELRSLITACVSLWNQIVPLDI